jgi:TRAP-type mannitol/chloroaromatic compound transport system permease small subunit
MDNDPTGRSTAGDNSISRYADAVSVAVGHAIAWLTLLMVLTTAFVVVLRYVFDAGFIWLQESMTWMHSAVFMLGAAYTLQRDAHVRVDVFYREMSERRRAWVNLAGVIVFVFPLAGFVFFESLNYVQAAWSIREVSRDSGGLPYPAIPLLKSMLLAMPALVAVQGVSLAVRSVLIIRGDR